jgi:hypothetical protein
MEKMYKLTLAVSKNRIFGSKIKRNQHHLSKPHFVGRRYTPPPDPSPLGGRGGEQNPDQDDTLIFSNKNSGSILLVYHYNCVPQLQISTVSTVLTRGMRKRGVGRGGGEWDRKGGKEEETRKKKKDVDNKGTEDKKIEREEELCTNGKKDKGKDRKEIQDFLKENRGISFEGIE